MAYNDILEPEKISSKGLKNMKALLDKKLLLTENVKKPGEKPSLKNAQISQRKSNDPFDDFLGGLGE